MPDGLTGLISKRHMAISPWVRSLSISVLVALAASNAWSGRRLSSTRMKVTTYIFLHIFLPCTVIRELIDISDPSARA